MFRNHTGKLKHTSIGHCLALNNFKIYLFALSLSSSSTSPSKMLPSFLKETKRNNCWSGNTSPLKSNHKEGGKGKHWLFPIIISITSRKQGIVLLWCLMRTIISNLKLCSMFCLHLLNKKQKTSDTTQKILRLFLKRTYSPIQTLNWTRVKFDYLHYCTFLKTWERTCAIYFHLLAISNPTTENVLFINSEILLLEET